MSIPTILREYKDGSLRQKDDGLKHNKRHHRLIMKGLDKMNGIHAFNRFEEEEFVESFQCHFRFVDILRDARYALATPVILDEEEE